MSEEERLELENELVFTYSKEQMIEKFVDELCENITLSDLWCKSQEENKTLHSIIKEVREYCENNKEFTQRLEDILEILDKENI